MHKVCPTCRKVNCWEQCHLDNFNPVRTAKHRPFLQLGINNKWVVKSPRWGHSKSHCLLFAVCCFVQLLRACKNSYHAVLCCTSLLSCRCNGLIKAPTGGEVMSDSWSVKPSVHHKSSSECCMGFFPGCRQGCRLWWLESYRLTHWIVCWNNFRIGLAVIAAGMSLREKYLT